MRLKHAALIATILVIVAGVALISPLYLRHQTGPGKPRVMLTISLVSVADAPDWCKELGGLLDNYQIGATVFITGNIAQEYPQCLTYLGDRVDIGNRTFNNSNLTQISDYSLKLQEVQQGKSAVDAAYNLDSRLFQAPYGATDQDIYSLLSRSGIIADFSYLQQYNVFQNNQFVKFEAAGFTASEQTPDISDRLAHSGKPDLVFFDNTRPVSELAAFLSRLDMTKFDFVNASQLVGTKLTAKGDAGGDSRFASN